LTASDSALSPSWAFEAVRQPRSPPFAFVASSVDRRLTASTNFSLFAAIGASGFELGPRVVDRLLLERRLALRGGLLVGGLLVFLHLEVDCRARTRSDAGSRPGRCRTAATRTGRRLLRLGSLLRLVLLGLGFLVFLVLGLRDEDLAELQLRTDVRVVLALARLVLRLDVVLVRGEVALRVGVGELHRASVHAGQECDDVVRHRALAVQELLLDLVARHAHRVRELIRHELGLHLARLLG